MDEGSATAAVRRALAGHGLGNNWTATTQTAEPLNTPAAASRSSILAERLILKTPGTDSSDTPMTKTINLLKRSSSASPVSDSQHTAQPSQLSVCKAQLAGVLKEVRIQLALL